MKVPYDRPTKVSWSSPSARRITSMSWATSTLPRWPSRSPSVARHSSATALAAGGQGGLLRRAVGSEVRGVERRNRVAARDRGALTHAARVEADDVEPVAHLGADLEPSGHAPHAGGAGSARVHHQRTDPLARDVGRVADQRQVERRTTRVLVAHRDGEGGAVEPAAAAVPVERDGLGQRRPWSWWSGARWSPRWSRWSWSAAGPSSSWSPTPLAGCTPSARPPAG